ncbi:MAG: 2'-deoxycytidine 5'-triphosphate deaminase [Hyphomicrobiales bacterium]|nr:2'-deoxycytidine 5'-triphosphate deaminase [Hyphomicrobiales bacterium]
MIRRLADAGGVTSLNALAAGQIQPASLDLRLGDCAWRVRASFLPGAGVPVEDKLRRYALHRIDLTAGAVLEVGCVYVAPLMEGLALPGALCASANPKSSTGRLDVFTRVIADGASSFDQAPAGYRGPLYLEICPQTFPILVRAGSRLAQIRFRRGEAAASDQALADLHRTERLVSGQADIAGGLALSADLSGGASGVVGYRAKRHTGVVDVDAVGACAVDDYWEPIAARDRRLILDPDEFYILASREAVHVPPTHAAEMTPFNPLVGEFRVHYAGFFDPGFGHAGAGGEGARAVLEVRSHKVPFLLEDGQIVGRLVYERLVEPPETLYGASGSHYQAQGLKLSKHFR